MFGSKPSQLSVFYSVINDEIKFNSISFTLESVRTVSFSVCFRAKVMSDGTVLFNKLVDSQIDFEKQQTMADFPVKIDFSAPYTSAWYYYEISAFDCETKEEYYRFYRRDFYDSEQTGGDIAVFEKC
jgi:hypothetical protein